MAHSAAFVVIDTGLKRRNQPATMQNKPPKGLVHPLEDREGFVHPLGVQAF
jgi:hypothetical protein